ncbi:site-2 protease family protein [Thermocoleostomius sinensis]|jgi:Zn-dependent protease|uniref:Zinc metalloprotease n=1 Tax=Thermocoleostomius sinensis A174 TaxID=2016057 RepID=A0A9E8ZCP8_9CYAN|nr:site-2 protease family protein [Thermocoleostomius sinensis]WAL60441.1 site-2 protease family protein [Thermocoleostomius sinensis A174]
MRSGWRIGALFGIPLLLDSSWFIILGLITFLYGARWQQEDWGADWGWIAGFAAALLLFVSVLLHELGHSLVAKAQGIQVNSITLFVFGGIASIDRESKTPGQAFQVAIAGPAVSLALAIVLFGVSRSLPLSPPVREVVDLLWGINLVLALFNMIPGLPLDGGQVLKALIWKVTGNRLQGIRWAARVGQLLGWTAIILGVTAYLTSFSFGALWLALIGWFGVRNATAYGQVTDLQEALLQLTASDAMTREFRVLDANLTLRQFADDYLLSETSHSTVYYAASNGRYRGLVGAEDLHHVERSLWETQTLQTIVHPLSDIPSVSESTALTEVVNVMETQEIRRVTVLSPAGAVAGVIDRGDIVRAIATKLNISVPDSLIQQIKEEGAYPPGLQIPALAKAATD